MRFLQAIVVGAFLFGLAGPAVAQSLGDVAKEQKQKRQGKPAPKVITEDDLGRATKRGTVNITGENTAEGAEAPADATVAPEAGTSSAEAGVAPVEGQPTNEEGQPQQPGKKGKSEDELKAEARAAWQKKLAAAREKVQAHTTNVANIQRDLNDNSGGFYTDRRAQVQKMLDDEKAKLAAAQSTVDQLEEEGRRAGWPR